MIEFALITVVLLAGSLLYQLRVAAKAPVGYQDESGFHFGTAQAPAMEDTEFMPAPTLAFSAGRQHGPTPRPLVAVSGHHA